MATANLLWTPFKFYSTHDRLCVIQIIFYSRKSKQVS